MNAVLVTRPQPDADALAKILHEKDFHVIVDPLFTMEFSTSPPAHKNHQALLATSRNAIRALQNCKAVENFTDTPLFTVGEETEQCARMAGFDNVKRAGSSAASLAELVAAECNPKGGPLLYLAGTPRKDALEIALAASGFTLDVWKAYAAKPSPALQPETLDTLRQRKLDAIMLFSERASMHFLQLASDLPDESLKFPVFICLSAHVAMPLQQKGLRAVTAEAPRLHAMIELLCA